MCSQGARRRVVQLLLRDDPQSDIAQIACQNVASMIRQAERGNKHQMDPAPANWLLPMAASLPASGTISVVTPLGAHCRFSTPRKVLDSSGSTYLVKLC